jgi:hypothetical protein
MTRSLRNRFKPGVETLEARTVPTTITWTGANTGMDNNWSDRLNWAGGVAPGARDIANFTNSGTLSFTANVDMGFTVAGVTIDGSWGGTINANSDLAVTGDFSLASGTLAGAANVTVSGRLTWSGGTMSGTGSTTVTPSGTWLISGVDINLDTRTLNNEGTATWTGQGNLLIGPDGAVINNEKGATWDFQFDASIVGAGTLNTARFNNAGTLKKSAGNGNLTHIDPMLVNNIGTDLGTVEVSSGDLVLDGGDSGASHGNFISDTGSKLTFGGGTFTLMSDSLVSGPGTVEFTATPTVSSTVKVTGLYTVTGTTLVDGNPTGTSATANFSSNVTVSSLTLLGGGVLTGTGKVTVSGALTWSAGTMSGTGGTGSTTVARTATLLIGGAGASDETLDARTLNNQGKAVWTGSDNVILKNQAVINNLARASWDIQTDAHIDGPTGTFNNAGTLKKTQGTSTTTIFCAFNNTGKLEVHTGTVDVVGTVSQFSGSTLTGGSWAVFGSAKVSATLTLGSAGSIDTIGSKTNVILSGLNSTFTNINGANGLGKVLAGGSFSVLSGQSFTTTGNLDNAGSVILSRGMLTVTGTVAQLSGTSLTGGTWIVGPSSNLNFPSGSNITSLAGANVTLNGLHSNFGALSNLSTIGSTSSLTLSGGRSFATVGDLTNNGKLTLGPGSLLTVNGNFTQTSTATLTDQVKASGSTTTAGKITTGASGTVGLSGNFVLTVTGLPGLNVPFTILDDGNASDAISGTFQGLGEGSTISFKGHDYTISYTGGDGNDVTLTRIT